MSHTAMPPVYIDFLNRFDVEALNLTNAEIVGAIETQLRLQGEGHTTIQPRVFLEPGVARGALQRAAWRDRGRRSTAPG